MADVGGGKIPTLTEEYLLKEKLENLDTSSKPVEVTEVGNPLDASSDEVASKKSKDTAGDDSTDIAPDTAGESNEANPAAADENSEVNQAAAAAEESSETDKQEGSGNQETEEEFKFETAPVDFRFPTTNQTRHCYTRYIEYHRCIAAKGEGAPECTKFRKYYRSLCPNEWVERWDEQRENGTFPGPL